MMCSAQHVALRLANYLPVTRVVSASLGTSPDDHEETYRRQETVALLLDLCQLLTLCLTSQCDLSFSPRDCSS
jgi:hypothetical protein